MLLSGIAFVFLFVNFPHILAAPLKEKPHSKTSQGIQAEANRTIADLKVGDIIENDIILDRHLLKFIKGSLKRGAIINPTNRNRRWPDVLDSHGKRYVIVPYELQKGFWSGLSSKAVKAFNDAKARFHKDTCIRFVAKKPDDRDYIYIYPGEGCWSQVGRHRGKQSISIGNGCAYKGHVMHELMHTIGFLHEQSRMDRDNYVKIYRDRIIPGRIINFDKYHQDTGGLPYDLKSMLHYSNMDSSATGSPTIESITDPSMTLGRKNDFSPGDIARINMLYNCPMLVNNLVDYTVTAVTADTFTAGTDADVEINIVGKKGETGEKMLETGGSHDDFERGSNKEFDFVGPYVGKVERLKIRLSRRSPGWFNGWKPVKFKVEDPRTRDVTTFMYNKWIYPGQHEILLPTSVLHKG